MPKRSLALWSSLAARAFSVMGLQTLTTTFVLQAVALDVGPLGLGNLGLIATLASLLICPFLGKEVAYSPSLALSYLLLACAGFFDALSLSVREVLLQLRAPAHLRGRIYAWNSFLVNASDELSEWESGVSAHFLGIRGSLKVGGWITLLVSGGFGVSALSGFVGKVKKMRVDMRS